MQVRIRSSANANNFVCLDFIFRVQQPVCCVCVCVCVCVYTVSHEPVANFREFFRVPI